MRPWNLLILATLLATPVLAQDVEPREHIMYLHENLHIVPERINVQVGDTLRVNVINAGTSPHDVVFCGDAPNGGSQCNDRWAFSPRLNGGMETNITVPVKDAGTFEFYCSIPGHKQGGMKGEIIVQGEPEKKLVPAPSFLPALVLLALAALVLRRG